MDFPNSKVLLVSRLDGTRGPLGVAKAVHSRLADKYGCKLEEFSDFADVFKLIAEIPFNTRTIQYASTKMASVSQWPFAGFLSWIRGTVISW